MNSGSFNRKRPTPDEEIDLDRLKRRAYTINVTPGQKNRPLGPPATRTYSSPHISHSPRASLVPATPASSSTIDSSRGNFTPTSTAQTPPMSHQSSNTLGNISLQHTVQMFSALLDVRFASKLVRLGIKPRPGGFKRKIVQPNRDLSDSTRVSVPSPHPPAGCTSDGVAHACAPTPTPTPARERRVSRFSTPTASPLPVPTATASPRPPSPHLPLRVSADPPPPTAPTAVPPPPVAPPQSPHTPRGVDTIDTARHVSTTSNKPPTPTVQVVRSGSSDNPHKLPLPNQRPPQQHQQHRPPLPHQQRHPSAQSAHISPAYRHMQGQPRPGPGAGGGGFGHTQQQYGDGRDRERGDGARRDHRGSSYQHRDGRGGRDDYRYSSR